MTSQCFGHLLQSLKSGLLSLAGGVLLVVATVSSAEPEPAAVGQVTLVLGQAELESSSGLVRTAAPEAVVHIGDRILTESNGHVHIRFVDGALVSVRPNSELVVDRYEFNRQRPELSAVKFTLNEGIARAISGQAAKSARERFRLNTPIAAIGVRGTDFLVSTNSRTTKAKVKEGIIVLAPYSPECSIDALGPCIANAVELQGDSLQMLELNIDGEAPLPRVMPAQNIRNPSLMQQQVQVALNGSEDAPTAEGSEPGEPVAVAVNDIAADRDPVEVDTSDQTLLEGASIRIATDAESIAAAPPEFTPDVALSDDELTSRQLVWGRYSNATEDRERITVEFEVAFADRYISIGNTQYGLFRPEEDTKQVNPGLGVISFSLATAQAFYNDSTGVVALDVGGGSLAIDFDQNLFATELNLSHELTGAIDFQAAGTVRDGGYFYNEEETISGAVSLDGREAGYYFEQQLESGGIQGLTLWDSQ